ncbi:hypothetical protein Pcinc_044482 [Petrolisthes cinctipes]|uniref:Uncharacterized protein n=1 Tax=Petrolisthes cinctipes TaxID=88211 RepID=A0AAE1EGW1_PETCI|nr:hypothetical protein Pcinc_044482 [Petrolisthes cinctipes]
MEGCEGGMVWFDGWMNEGGKDGGMRRRYGLMGGGMRRRYGLVWFDGWMNEGGREERKEGWTDTKEWMNEGGREGRKEGWRDTMEEGFGGWMNVGDEEYEGG